MDQEHSVISARRKTFTLQSAPAPLATNPCNRTFVSDPDTGVGGGVSKEVYVGGPPQNKKLVSESLKNKNHSQLMGVSAAMTSLSFRAPQRPNPPLPHNRETAPETKLNFAKNALKPVNRSDQNYVKSLLEKSSRNCRRFTNKIYDIGDGDISMNSTSSGEKIFEKSLYGATPQGSKKLGIELDQLRLKEKELINGITRLKNSAMMLEESNKAELKEIDKRIKNRDVEIERIKKSKQKLKKTGEKWDKEAQENTDKVADQRFQNDLTKDMLRIFLKVGEDHKCTDERFCKEFHKDGNCQMNRLESSAPAAEASTAV